MKALTLHQPWASLIAEGHKTIETRSWRPPKDLIGQTIAIHAGKKLVRLKDPLWLQAVDRCLGQNWSDNLPSGAIIALVRLTEVNKTESLAFELKEPEATFGDYSRGRWAWSLSDRRLLSETIPTRGWLGFWSLGDKELRQLPKS